MGTLDQGVYHRVFICLLHLRQFRHGSASALGETLRKVTGLAPRDTCRTGCAPAQQAGDRRGTRRSPEDVLLSVEFSLGVMEPTTGLEPETP